jgi:hypothetical protein
MNVNDCHFLQGVDLHVEIFEEKNMHNCPINKSASIQDKDLHFLAGHCTSFVVYPGTDGR